MTELNQVFKCGICGNIVEVLHAGKGSLVCCNKLMELLQENTVDASVEKHKPVMVIEGDEVVFKVGSVRHPMEEEHYIEWIEVLTGGNVYRKFLKPGDSPEAKFKVDDENLKARCYCNLHGLWSMQE
ncbi:desulfoferrodoxin [Desulfallas sp. Bu1-1]|uniref:desulfoferrodoxin n=1 Tax=Desulfallas sp. Bu1-1 TaxID=2787620 RepID=UPI00189DBFBB|nr:desulfoferrodoxin [Desulfallas sp. Bu1-1]MBF7083799.1 desulfoferrodoxin [Desulfallas sp. Bu1-1]